MNQVLNEGSTLALAAEVEAAPGEVAKVGFCNDETLLGEVTQPPYQLAYRPGSLPAGNYSLTVRVTAVDGTVTTTEPVTVTAQCRRERPVTSYDYEEEGEGVTKSLRLTIPDNLKLVRGILVNTNGSSGDTRTSWQDPWFREFMALHGFAFLGAKQFNSHLDSYTIFTHALPRFAQDAGHPELATVPFVASGFSAGGGFANRLVMEAPERVIAAAPCSAYIQVDRPESLTVPTLTLSGELETRLNNHIDGLIRTYRVGGAPHVWGTVQGKAHEGADQASLVMPFLSTIVGLRYPAGADPRQPVALLPVDTTKGWLVDHTTWASPAVKIVPVAEYTGDRQTSGWLPTRKMAYLYRAYATYNPPLQITSLSQLKPPWVDPGANVTIVVDASALPGWRKLECYDGDTLVGTVTQGSTRWTATNLKSGYHSFHVLAEDAQGVTRTSAPRAVIVRAD
jgi:hypothetical protein